MAAFGLPRRLTKLYSDTKDDIVAEQAKLENVPELNALHRRFRIQKDRLVAWGLEWSDNSGAASQGSIDESVAQAGLTETVTSVLGTIQDILDEADRIRSSEEPTTGDSKGGKSWAKPTIHRSWSPADKARYEDLAKDLAVSISTLYDLSRSRRAFSQGTNPRQQHHLAKSVSAPSIHAKGSLENEDYNDSTLTLVSHPTIPISIDESESIPRIDPSSLILPEEEPPPYESIGIPSCSRLIGHLRRTQSSENPWNWESEQISATSVLIEYVGFDPVYRLTGVSPPSERLESLLGILGRGVGRFGDGPGAQGFGTLRCLGYFEDPKQPRFGFVFELPSFVNGAPSRSLRPSEVQALRPVTLLSVLQQSSKSFGGQSNSAVPNVPALEQRFRIALNLVLSFSKLHTSGFVHKDVNSSNILIFRKPKSSHHLGSHKQPEYELRSPYLCSFDLFSEYNVEDPPSESVALNIYRHPHDPRAQQTNTQYTPPFDMYGLALILLEIGLWVPLADIFKAKYTLADFKIRLEDIWTRRLAGKCGTAYMHAVRDCLSAADQELSSADIRLAYDRIVGRLHRCCLLGDEEPYHHDLGGQYPRPSTAGMNTTKRAYPTYPLGHHSASPRVSKLQKRRAFEKVDHASDGGMLHARELSPHPEQRFLFHIQAIEDTSGLEWDPNKHQKEHDSHRLTHVRPPSMHMDNVVDAARTIQRAWRTSRHKLSFRENRKKVVLIQNHWRERKERRSTPSAEHARSHERSPIAQVYPTPEPDTMVDEMHIQTAIKLKQPKSTSKRKLLVQPLWKPSPNIAAEWDQTILPRLMRICERALRDSTESSSIDLFGVGTSPSDAKATIVVTCTSTAKVKAALARKFSYDRGIFDLKIHKGKIKRSKLSRPRRRRLPHRSMMDEDDEVPPLNKFYQQRPVCGASIGAYNGEHLPPVSYGGVVLVDGEAYGMSVHHMLDAPSEDDESEYEDDVSETGTDEAVRSSAKSNSYPWISEIGSQPSLQSLPDISLPFEISDDEGFEDGASDYANDFADEAYSDDESEIAPSEPGDVPGIEAGFGEEILITQPAIDDVDDDFFPCKEDREEDHLDSHELGHVHASSGIRRWNRNGVVHEIDWSLLKLKDERLQPYNIVQGGKRFCARGVICPKLVDPVHRRCYEPEEDEYPNQVARAEDLGSLQVHSFGRTSGLKGGVISHTMTAVKVFGRKSYSRSWHVSGGLGVGGDSGAWVIDNEQGRVCGHVLAWCDRNHVAYICPMEVLLEDIKHTLGARKIYLPGSEEEEGVMRVKGGFEMPDIRQLSIGTVGEEPRSRFMEAPSRIEVVRSKGQMA